MGFPSYAPSVSYKTKEESGGERGSGGGEGKEEEERGMMDKSEIEG